MRVRQDDDDVSYQVLARGDGADAVHDAAVLRDYFNLDTGLAALSDDWAARDGRFAAIRDYIAGVDNTGCSLSASYLQSCVMSAAGPKKPPLSVSVK